MISPGGVGYDINCGVRLVRSNLTRGRAAADRATDGRPVPRIPAGVGQGRPVSVRRARNSSGSWAKASRTSRPGVWPPTPTSSTPRPTAACDGAEPDLRQRPGAGARRRPVRHARLRQPFPRGPGRRRRCSTTRPPRSWGSPRAWICVMIHSGSRGLGYQVCDDYLARCGRCPKRYGIELPDRQLVCAPVREPGGPAVPRRHAGGGELRLGQPAAADAQLRGSRSPEFFGRSWEAARHAPGLRRGPQYRQDGETHGRRRAQDGLRTPQGRDPAFPPGHPEVPSQYRAWVSGDHPGDMGRA